ncbi:MAG: ABC transporter ATP-binding protein [Lachnospiraceae bacterium]|nr:ABC transporter ATP-binding protein [Lachnospiraceae bacterium]
MALLEIKDMHTNYGVIKAVRGISFQVEQGEIVTLIGSNGAGKSTTLNTISGLVPIGGGEIWFDGQNITKLETHDRVKMGIALSPEGRQVFPDLSVEGNLRMGAYTVSKETLEEEQKNAYELFPILYERRKQAAGTLSGGEQQMLAVARALMCRPQVLMLDEPSLGLAPLIVAEIFKLIQRINKMGTTILLVEQNARMALSISDRGYVLETGKIVLSGTGAELAADEKVRSVYLGGL